MVDALVSDVIDNEAACAICGGQVTPTLGGGTSVDGLNWTNSRNG